MKFCRELYLDEYSNRNLLKIKKLLKKHTLQPLIFLIVIGQNSERVEIIHSVFLKQDYYKAFEPCIVGIANGYDNALAIVKQMILDSYAFDSTPDIKNMLRNKIACQKKGRILRHIVTIKDGE